MYIYIERERDLSIYQEKWHSVFKSGAQFIKINPPEK